MIESRESRESREVREWTSKLLIPIGSLLINAAITYGVVNTQLQWLRSDIERQQKQIDRVEGILIDNTRR